MSARWPPAVEHARETIENLIASLHKDSDDDTEDEHIASAVAHTGSTFAAEPTPASTGGLNSTTDRSMSTSTTAQERGNVDQWLGERVILDQDEQNTGMVADGTFLHLLVAMDDGRWTTVATSEAKERLSITTTTPALGVVGFVYEGKGILQGSLFGQTPCEPIFGIGAAGAFEYYAFLSKPAVERDIRLRSQKGEKDLNRRSYALGDIVEQCDPPDGMSPRQAVVVRVVVKDKAGSSQARKLIILYELQSPGDGQAPKDPPEFFPASWRNWTRIPKARVQHERNADVHDHTENHETVAEAAIEHINAVCART